MTKPVVDLLEVIAIQVCNRKRNIFPPVPCYLDSEGFIKSLLVGEAGRVVLARRVLFLLVLLLQLRRKSPRHEVRNQAIGIVDVKMERLGVGIPEFDSKDQ